MGKTFNIPDFLKYINIKGTGNDSLQVIHYDEYENILLKSPPVKIDFYFLAIKQNVDIQPPIEEMSDSYVYLSGPGNAMEWEMTGPISGYSILISEKLLGKFARDYKFMDYNNHEALFLKHDEKVVLYDLFIKAHLEFAKNQISRDIIVSYSALILTYAQAFYERQFESRSKIYHKVVADFYEQLHAYFRDEASVKNLPSVGYFAEKANLSTNYFGNLVKHFTGNSPIEHIHQHIIHIAKNKLRLTKLSVNEIAYSLGFDYPTYFTRFFRKETGITPKVFRNQ
ncbi:helix-turn-helix domain-containing protein [Flavihumibacter solisilvae]|uniref:Transcriptional regulator n=1 Tax=Flavihumibacter solisilvae TaxID=1349421 RepID=A0A0C1LFW4_9BACT|nr:helix-turn-helix domain-containing protein [Flavihumibacter solisilvae]KIC94243.1 transcriptional regulator [Flavihumibacter solisilvae]